MYKGESLIKFSRVSALSRTKIYGASVVSVVGRPTWRSTHSYRRRP